jgi:hypothetical protein
MSRYLPVVAALLALPHLIAAASARTEPDAARKIHAIELERARCDALYRKHPVAPARKTAKPAPQSLGAH